MLGVRIVWARYDKTRRGYHVIVRFTRRFSPVEIVAMQALCGSDSKREALNLARVMSRYNRNGIKRWNLLYRVKLERD